MGHFGFYSYKICHGLSLCKSSHFVLYAWSNFLALFSSYVKITKLLKIGHLIFFCYQKLIRSLLRQFKFKRRYDGNFFLKRVSGHRYLKMKPESNVENVDEEERFGNGSVDGDMVNMAVGRYLRGPRLNLQGEGWSNF